MAWRRDNSTFSISDLSNFYVKHKKSLVNYSMRMLKDSETAEEIVQETMLKLMLVAPEFSSEAQAFAYIKKSINNRIIDQYRREGARPNLISLELVRDEIEFSIDSNVDIGEIISAAEDAEIVRNALSLLSPAERAALVMWEMQGRSSKEIARELGIKESSVKHTLARARKSLRNILSSYIVDEKNGLTALDLLSKSYQKLGEVAKNSGRATLSLLIILSVYLSFYSLLPNIVVSDTSAKVELGQPNFDARENQSLTLDSGLENRLTKVVDTNRNSKQNSISRTRSSSPNLRKTTSLFSGLDSGGIPTGFTITDTEGSMGQLGFFGREAVLTETGFSISGIAKTIQGGPNLLVTQNLSQDGEELTIGVSLAYGRSGEWIPIESQLAAIETKRLINGQYLVTATLQVGSEIKPLISIPSATGGRDLTSAPNRIILKVLLNQEKSRVVAEAIQVVETKR